MSYLIKNVLILDNRSPYYHQIIDIELEDGRIVQIGKNISPQNNAIIIDGGKLILSPAFVDINATSGEPDDLEAETLESLIQVGAKGGYAYVAHIPNEKKMIQSKSDVAFLQSQNSNAVCKILPIGNITRTENDQVLAPLMDMRNAGAVAFSDGNDHTLKMNVLKNALLYTKGFKGKLMIHPEKKELSKNGHVNQGMISVSLGYKGIPKEAEYMAIQEIAHIAEYTDTNVLILNVTTPESIDIISQANKKSKRITSSVSSLHLLCDERSLEDYDTNYKLSPPLRSEKDRKKLIKALLDGKIDIVYSQHSPKTTEDKVLEFDLASNGAIHLQTSFLTCLEALGVDNVEKVIDLMSYQPSTFFEIKLPVFDQGVCGEFVIVDLEDTFVFTRELNASKSKNSPFFDKHFKGKIKGLIAHKTQTFFD